MTFLKGWRTRLVSLAGVTLAFLELIDPGLLGNALGPDWKNWVIFAYPVIYGLLREVTNTPAGKKS
ncbi:hypothetical protein MXMO3_01727 [Maritalea myrionectae]|uniref:Uncharacterized protein n=1 Tax=Maritalea myrionectae TaxID=454601 RepID=A0A2R4ME52_9HYPH|nr:hypothetical protein [Maritalea myrionectae]AVX04253.1 hypothetical protein MXMO3_01727 [Maritalea myrionectae]